MLGKICRLSSQPLQDFLKGSLPRTMARAGGGVDLYSSLSWALPYLLMGSLDVCQSKIPPSASAGPGLASGETSQYFK